jgi:hypothetical protein
METVMPALLVMVPIATIGIQISTRLLTRYAGIILIKKEYKRVKVGGNFVPDTANMTISLNEAVQTVHLPERTNCLQCHAKAGGGDAVKRGDLALASADTTDVQFDVHMAVSAGDLTCRECHIFRRHKFAGKGSDIRPTDLDIKITCSACHTNKNKSNGHSSSTIGRHVSRVACQTCHIPYYAKDANDKVRNLKFAPNATARRKVKAFTICTKSMSKRNGTTVHAAIPFRGPRGI